MDRYEAFQCFVGSSVDEFLDGMTVEEAVENLMEEKWWEAEGEEAPDNLAELITDYCQLVLEGEALEEEDTSGYETYPPMLLENYFKECSEDPDIIILKLGRFE